jgi:hypothetical protein
LIQKDAALTDPKPIVGKLEQCGDIQGVLWQGKAVKLPVLHLLFSGMARKEEMGPEECLHEINVIL